MFFTLFAIGVSAAETAIAIAIIINIFRNLRHVNIDKVNKMKH
jgi:NADH-quinone oxidoreductase subunit K